MGQFTFLPHRQTVKMLKESLMIIALAVATVHGYNLGNDDHSYDYGYQQHSVHKRSPQIPGLRIFGGGASAYGTLASAAVGALSGIYGGGALGLGSLSGILGKTSLLFGKREAEPGYGYRSYSSGYDLGNDDHSYDYGNQQHSVHKRSPQ